MTPAAPGKLAVRAAFMASVTVLLGMPMGLLLSGLAVVRRDDKGGLTQLLGWAWVDGDATLYLVLAAGGLVMVLAWVLTFLGVK